jgi:hypothetical protein
MHGWAFRIDILLARNIGIYSIRTAYRFGIGKRLLVSRGTGRYPNTMGARACGVVAETPSRSACETSRGRLLSPGHSVLLQVFALATLLASLIRGTRPPCSCLPPEWTLDFWGRGDLGQVCARFLSPARTSLRGSSTVAGRALHFPRQGSFVRQVFLRAPSVHLLKARSPDEGFSDLFATPLHCGEKPRDCPVRADCKLTSWQHSGAESSKWTRRGAPVAEESIIAGPHVPTFRTSHVPVESAENQQNRRNTPHGSASTSTNRDVDDQVTVINTSGLPRFATFGTKRP